MLLRRLWRALSTFLSLNLSCSRLAPPDGARVDGFCVLAGRCAAELLLDVGVILVWLLALDSGRGARLRLDPWLLSSILPVLRGAIYLVFLLRLFVVFSGQNEFTQAAEWSNGASDCAWTGMLLAMVVGLAIF